MLVESLPDGAKKLDLSEQTIQTDVELKLRLAGLTVIRIEESDKVAGSPYIYVNVNLTDDADAASVMVDLNQDATLSRNSESVIGATTWQHGSLISHPTREGIRGKIKDLVDEFLNDWLAVNPKPR